MVILFVPLAALHFTQHQIGSQILELHLQLAPTDLSQFPHQMINGANRRNFHEKLVLPNMPCFELVRLSVAVRCWSHDGFIRVSGGSELSHVFRKRG